MEGGGHSTGNGHSMWKVVATAQVRPQHVEGGGHSIWKVVATAQVMATVCGRWWPQDKKHGGQSKRRVVAIS